MLRDPVPFPSLPFGWSDCAIAAYFLESAVQVPLWGTEGLGAKSALVTAHICSTAVPRSGCGNSQFPRAAHAGLAGKSLPSARCALAPLARVVCRAVRPSCNLACLCSLASTSRQWHCAAKGLAVIPNAELQLRPGRSAAGPCYPV